MISRTNISWLRGMFAILVAAFVSVALVRPAHAQEDKTAQIEQSFREAVDLYKQTKYSDAQRKLRHVLSMEPRHELAARLVDEAGTRVMAQMMADSRMGSEPTYIWQLYRQFNIRKMANKERMTKMAARLIDPNTSDDERALLYREFGELGHHAVPILAPHLKAATHEDHRTFARIAITRMGHRAVLPVIELLGHSDVLMRQNAIGIIGDITPLDPRALPALKSILDSGAEQPSVKSQAAKVFARISGMNPDAGKTASDYYYDAANRYFLDRAGVAEEAEDVEGLTWHLSAEGELIPVGYPLWAWNDQMAEEHILRGLKLNPEHYGLPALWAAELAAQHTEVQDLVDVSNEMPVQHNFTAEEKKDLEEWQKKLVDARRLIYAVGKENVNSALNKVLADIRTFPGHARLPSVGALLARELALLDPNGDLLTPPGDIHQVATLQSPVSTSVALVPVQISTEEPRVRVRIGANSLEAITEKPEDAKNKEKKKKKDLEPLAPVVDTVAPVSSSSGLVNGLDSPEQIVQYACALALAQTDKFPMKWIGSEKVAGLLGRGISEAKSIQILLVEEDTNYANDLRGKLEALGYGVSLAASGRDGVTQARSFPPKDIAVISNALRRDLSSEQLLEELRADVRTRYLVYGVLSAQADRTAMQARFGSEAALVEREVSGGDLKNQIEAIAAKRPAESLTKRKALETSIECATALTKVDPRDTYLLLNDAVEHAIAALANRKDEVRIPSAIFIGRVAGGSFADKAAIGLKAVIEDANNAAELRRVALIAYGSVVKQGLEEITAKVQADADQGVKDAGARAFGQTQRSRADIIKFINANRIEGEKKTK